MGWPGPSPGVLVSSRRALSESGTEIEYQSSATICRTSWTVPGAPLVNPNIDCMAVPEIVVIAPPKEIVDPIDAFRAATAAAFSAIAMVVLLSEADTIREPYIVPDPRSA